MTIRTRQKRENGTADSKRAVANGGSTSSKRQAVSGLARATFAEWTVIFALIFGGCCSNVFALEMVVKEAPNSGNLITFAQFLIVAAEGFLHHLEPSYDKGSVQLLKKRNVPLSRWFIQVVLFFTVSVLNNIALGYRISVPVHIVFRSGGLFVSMLMGWLIAKRRYNIAQISAVVLVTAGVVLATLSNSKHTTTSDADAKQYAIGISFLTIALVLSCLMGLYQEKTYSTYGNHWREGLFYSHFLALPFFAIFADSIRQQFRLISASPSIPLLSLLPEQLVSSVPIPLSLQKISAPSLLIFLVLNTLTQYVCISGVHRLTSLATSLTLNLILNVRKLVSLVVSVVYFGNVIESGTIAGTAMVFVGTGLYSWGSAGKPSTRNKKLQ